LPRPSTSIDPSLKMEMGACHPLFKTTVKTVAGSARTAHHRGTLTCGSPATTYSAASAQRKCCVGACHVLFVGWLLPRCFVARAYNSSFRRRAPGHVCSRTLDAVCWSQTLAQSRSNKQCSSHDRCPGNVRICPQCSSIYSKFQSSFIYKQFNPSLDHVWVS